MKKRLLSALLASSMALTLTACGGGDDVSADDTGGESWAVYWYLCGSSARTLNASFSAVG